MKDLLEQLYKSLTPVVTRVATEQFGVSEEKAKHVLPTVAPALFSEIKAKAESPAQNAGLFKEVATFLQNAPAPSEAAGSAPASIVEGLLGNQMGGLVGTLSQQLGLSEPKSKSLLMSVVPMVLAFLKQRSDDGSLASMLGPILGENSKGKIETLEKLLEGSSKASSALSGLKGMLGR